MTIITRIEREDLQRLVRQREKVLKSAAKQRSAELLAEFENQLGSEFSFDDDAVWQQATQEAEIEVNKAKQKIAARCRELGIPGRFAPTLHMYWSVRGPDNLVKRRRDELRRMAESKIAAIEKKAVTEIELSCLQAQTEIAVAGLTSEAARGFIDRLPAIDSLMPAPSFAEIAGEAEPPISEQLVSPNALRQRRYRERQAALRNAQAPLTSAADACSDPPSSESEPDAH
ncbi:hypothetical protein ACQR09_22980 [Bradyrhizobium oligotrophicum]|uniref:hypothetical protein n=1 Tax=Bradyrhizobium oligotrophicum TaxID=44255 RepID=UPI003EB9F22E